MRARGGRGGARGRVGLELESGSVGEEDGPDERGPLGSDTGRGKGHWADLGQETGRTGQRGGKGGAPVGPKQKKTAREKEKRRKRKRWAGLKGVRGKKKSFSNFRKGFQTLSI